MTKFYFFVLIFVTSTTLSHSQNVWQSFKKLERPEKCWVIKHPFVARKAYKISTEAKSIADSLKNDTLLDGDANGGQVDAFRHVYWMARLTQEIGWRRARSLGNAHEKANYIQYIKGLKEDGAVPDKVSSDMDFLNNDIGIDVGQDNKKLSRDSLKNLIIQMILDGQMWVIKKDSLGRYLDCDGNAIPDSLLYHKWEVPKCLVKSDFLNKKRRH